MAIGSLVCVLARQVHCRHDRADHAFVPENAPVGEKGKLSGFGVEHDSTAWKFFVFNICWHGAFLLEQRPDIQMAPSVGLEIAVIFDPAYGRAVDQWLAVHYPEDADMGFFLAVH